MGGDPKLILSSSSKNEATSCVDMKKSSKDALGPETTAEDFVWVIGTHCLFTGGTGFFEGIGEAFLFALGPDMDIGSCEALSLASSASSPDAKGPGLTHLPATFLDDDNGLLEFAVAEGRDENSVGVGRLFIRM